MPHPVNRLWHSVHGHIVQWMGARSAQVADDADAGSAPPDVVAQPVSVAGAPPQAPPGIPSIAVLPFDNVTGKVKPTYLAEGVVGDIAMQLSHSNALFVVARQLRLTPTDHPVEPTKLGRDHGAGHVLGIHVRIDGEQVLIVAKLMVAENGKKVWVKHFDRAITDLSAVQDAIADAAALAIAADISEAERERIASKPIVSHRMIVGATASGRSFGGM